MPAGATGPEQKVIRTATAKLVIDDGDGGGILVDTEPPAAGVTASVRLADESITIAAGEAAVTVNPERGVTISFGGQS